MTDATKTEDSISPVLLVVATVGAASAAIAGIAFGPATMLGVAAGGALATLNLWAFGRIVRAFLAPGAKLAWSLLAALKLGGLFAVVYGLTRSGLVDIVPLIAGYAALPVGIVVAQLRAASALSEES